MELLMSVGDLAVCATRGGEGGGEGGRGRAAEACNAATGAVAGLVEELLRKRAREVESERFESRTKERRGGGEEAEGAQGKDYEKRRRKQVRGSSCSVNGRRGRMVGGPITHTLGSYAMPTAHFQLSPCELGHL